MTQLVLAGLAGAAVVWMPQVAVAQHAQAGNAPGLYATKAEAEAAAKQFNCTGAHAMGNQWMPCEHHSGAPSAPTSK